jgi:hypothetical protein
MINTIPGRTRRFSEAKSQPNPVHALAINSVADSNSKQMLPTRGPRLETNVYLASVIAKAREIRRPRYPTRPEAAARSLQQTL